MADDVDSPPIDIANVLGGLILEICIGLILYGVATAQAYVYSLNSNMDTLRLKGIVFVVWILETVHTALMLHQIYYYTIISFGNYDKVVLIDWSMSLALFAENSIVAIVQGFYIRRIWILSNNRKLPVIGLLILLSARIGFHTTAAVYGSAGLVTMVPTHISLTYPNSIVSPSSASFQEEFPQKLCVRVSNSLSASVDGFIAAYMIFFLLRSKTGFKRSDGIIRWLMAYSVNTGLVMMIVSISIAITYSSMRGSFVFAGLSTMVSKLYANSFLGTLNARDLLRGKLAATFGNMGSDLLKLQITAGDNVQDAPHTELACHGLAFTTGHTTTTSSETSKLHTTTEDDFKASSPV
ncbi:hypothetical protein QCA50_020635 [Cerrena zonata]|uniref:DUF6534 domain-containing protein n=1 Tax=Cerrena zonata TaxID=2478898 RepID=A0AAW0FA33_9APHY